MESIFFVHYLQLLLYHLALNNHKSFSSLSRFSILRSDKRKKLPPQTHILRDLCEYQKGLRWCWRGRCWRPQNPFNVIIDQFEWKKVFYRIALPQALLSGSEVIETDSRYKVLFTAPKHHLSLLKCVHDIQLSANLCAPEKKCSVEQLQAGMQKRWKCFYPRQCNRRRDQQMGTSPHSADDREPVTSNS